MLAEQRKKSHGKLTVEFVALLSIDFRSNKVVCGDSSKVEALIFFIIITLKRLKIKKIDKVYLDTCKPQQCTLHILTNEQSSMFSYDYSIQFIIIIIHGFIVHLLQL